MPGKKRDMRDVLNEIAADEMSAIFERAGKTLGKITSEWGGVLTIYQAGIPTHRVIGGYKYELPTRKKLN